MRVFASVLAIAVVGFLLAGCGPRPFILEGDADTVRIGYAVGDVAGTWPLARRHCAQFERDAQLIDPGLDSAYFKCVGRSLP